MRRLQPSFFSLFVQHGKRHSHTPPCCLQGEAPVFVCRMAFPVSSGKKGLGRACAACLVTGTRRGRQHTSNRNWPPWIFTLFHAQAERRAPPRLRLHFGGRSKPMEVTVRRVKKCGENLRQFNHPLSAPGQPVPHHYSRFVNSSKQKRSPRRCFRHRTGAANLIDTTNRACRKIVPQPPCARKRKEVIF